MVIAIVVLSILFVICAAGWFFRYITATTLLWYLQEKNYPFPTDEEVKKGNRFVVEHFFKDLFGSKH